MTQRWLLGCSPKSRQPTEDVSKLHLRLVASNLFRRLSLANTKTLDACPDYGELMVPKECWTEKNKGNNTHNAGVRKNKAWLVYVSKGTRRASNDDTSKASNTSLVSSCGIGSKLAPDLDTPLGRTLESHAGVLRSGMTADGSLDALDS